MVKRSNCSNYQWWRRLEDEIVCPISLEQINELQVEPVRLGSPYFEPETLARYAALALENPTTRKRLSQSECRAIDDHLRRNGLCPQHVEAAYLAAPEVSEESYGPVPRSQTADLLNSLISSSSSRARTQPALSSSSARTSTSARRSRHTAPRNAGVCRQQHPQLLDDDVGLTHGPMSDTHIAQATNTSNSSSNTAEQFPALGPPSGSGVQGAVPQPPSPTQLQRNQRQFDEQAAPAAHSDGDARLHERRQKQLAEAFGLPENKPSMFANASQNAFPTDVLNRAAQSIGDVQALEAQLDRLVDWYRSLSSARAVQRVPLEPSSSKDWRRLQHILAEAYGMASQAHGSGSKRTVHVILYPLSGVPAARLSDAARAHFSKEEVADASQESPNCNGDPAAADRENHNQDDERRRKLMIKLESEHATVDNVMKHLWDLEENESVGAARLPGNRQRVVLTFSSASAKADALERIGGGVRGEFSVCRQSTGNSDKQQQQAEEENQKEQKEESSKSIMRNTATQTRRKEQTERTATGREQSVKHQNAFNILLSTVEDES